MMFLLRMLMRNKGGSSMDPLHVSMTGVRMGERFLQIGCYDKALLSGLAAKVGLSGTAAVAAFDDEQVKRAGWVSAKIGALIDTHKIDGLTLTWWSSTTRTGRLEKSTRRRASLTCAMRDGRSGRADASRSSRALPKGRPGTMRCAI
jgi:hypothetical protein